MALTYASFGGVILYSYLKNLLNKSYYESIFII